MGVIHQNTYYSLQGWLGGLEKAKNTLTLDSGIDVAPGITVAPGTVGKNIKSSP